MNIEKDWITTAGLRAVVLMTSMWHRCGYVAVPSGHPLFGVEYGQEVDCLSIPDDEPIGKRSVLTIAWAAVEGRIRTSPDMVFDVHGSLTYSGGNGEYPAEGGGLWWFGFGCAHSGDAPSDEFIASKREEDRWLYESGGIHRSLDFCVSECESLAHQIVKRVEATP